MVAFTALLIGLVLGWALSRRRPLPGGHQEGLGHGPLLGWLEGAPVGWLIVDQADAVQLINPRAEQLLEIPGAALSGRLHLSQLVERLQRELLRLQELVNDLLELSRLENVLPPPALPQPLVDLAGVVEQAWSGLRPLADHRGVHLEIRSAAVGVAPPQVRGDAPRLHRLIYNLLDNALRYSPDGGVIRVSLREEGQWCLLAVRDQGPGLSPEDQERMFERFYRGDPSRARSRRGGSGLGLAIVRQIALTHGGRVQAANQPEGGAQLEGLLPLPG